MTDNRLVLVVGHGRSGTSLFTSIMKALGGHVPQPEVEPDETNPRGFGEPRWVVDFHISLLKRANVHPADSRPAAWEKTAQVGQRPKVQEELTGWLGSQVQQGAHVIVKDPRSLWFLPLWESSAGELQTPVNFATMLRRPQEVLKSRAAAYGQSRPQTSIAASWVNSMVQTEIATRHAPRAFARFDDLLADWESVVANVCDTLDLDILQKASAQQLQDVRDLVDPKLRRSSGGWEGLDVHPEVAKLADETWELLDALVTASSDEVVGIRTRLEDIRSRYDELYAFAEMVADSSVSAARRAGVKQGKAQAEKNAAPPAQALPPAVKVVERLKRLTR